MSKNSNFGRLDIEDRFEKETWFEVEDILDSRKHISLEVREGMKFNRKGKRKALESIVQEAKRAKGPVIVYVRSRKRARGLAAELENYIIDTGRVFSVKHYHGNMMYADKEERQKWFQNEDNDEKKILVATNAFGLGVNKSNVRAVFHWGPPTSVEEYVQEVGRAGRDGKPAKAILFRDVESDWSYITNCFIKTAKVEIDLFRDIMDFLSNTKENSSDGWRSYVELYDHLKDLRDSDTPHSLVEMHIELLRDLYYVEVNQQKTRCVKPTGIESPWRGDLADALLSYFGTKEPDVQGQPGWVEVSLEGVNSYLKDFGLEEIEDLELEDKLANLQQVGAIYFEYRFQRNDLKCVDCGPFKKEEDSPEDQSIRWADKMYRNQKKRFDQLNELLDLSKSNAEEDLEYRIDWNDVKDSLNQPGTENKDAILNHS